MSDPTSSDVITYAKSKDGARVKETIHSILANKIMTGIEAKKAEVSKAMFGPVVQPEESKEISDSSLAAEEIEEPIEEPAAVEA
ncbi:MAG: hypothetical protein MK200_00755 [Nitrosopumilus sp.]|jgi:hypothetical protein|nr:hypothetical protein [Nitrosopumilus sp.]